MDLVSSNAVSLFFVTETWLTDISNQTTATIKSYGYKMHHCHRDSGRGGGVAIIFRPNVNIIRVTTKHNKSFESVTVKIKLADNSCVMCSCIYRPDGNIPLFLSDFDLFLGDIFIKAPKLLICGDLNIHLDIKSKDSIRFIDIIESYGLKQLVHESTHKDGHILDVVITSHNIVDDDSIKILTQYSAEFPTCDHYGVMFSMGCNFQSVGDQKTIQFRNFKNINPDNFRSDLSESLMAKGSIKNFPSFQEAITHFNTGCSSVLQSHAPLLSKTIRDIPTAQWFDSEYKAVRARRRKAEKTWNKTQACEDYETFCLLRRKCNELASQKKSDFFKSKFLNHNNSQKGLYQFVDAFLDQTPTLVLPPNESMQTVATDFNNYFTEKIDKIHSGFPVGADTSASDNVIYSGKRLTEFEPTTLSEISEILKECKIKTSTNDPLPAFLIQDNIDELLPHICDIVNLSLSSGSIDGEKLAHITPLIKNQSLDSSCFKNYRPISNLSFIAKLIERVVLRRLNRHLDENNLNINLQSAYKKNHSCETLLIRIVNDLLIASDEDKATVVMLLDLSAAFDTVYQPKLLKILKKQIGIGGTALRWFESFICGRSQRVRIGDCESEDIIIKFGVPQGSVLGPVLFNIYIRSIYSTVQDKKFNIHGLQTVLQTAGA